MASGLSQEDGLLLVAARANNKEIAFVFAPSHGVTREQVGRCFYASDVCRRSEWSEKWSSR